MTRNIRNWFPTYRIQISNIKDTRSQNDLQAVETANKRLLYELYESKLSNNADLAKADMEKYNKDFAMVSRNHKVTVRALKKTEARKPSLKQELSNHCHALAVYRKVLDDFTLAVNAIPGQLEAIMAREKLLHTQIWVTLVGMFTAISRNRSLGNLPGNGWIHKEGASMLSGYKHAVQIVRACVKFNTPMP